MADFFTVNGDNSGFRHINLDQVRYIDEDMIEHDVMLHFGPDDEIKLKGGEARRFLTEWSKRTRKAVAA